MSDSAALVAIIVGGGLLATLHSGLAVLVFAFVVGALLAN